MNQHRLVFWVRDIGFAWRAWPLLDLNATSLCEQIFYAVIRQDQTACSSLIASASQEDFHELCNWLKELRMTTLFLFQLADMEHRASAPLISDGLRESLSADAHSEMVFYLRTLQHLESVISLLADAGVEYLMLKGPGVARTVYSAPQHRLHVDLDLLVRPHDVEIVSKALEEQGFERNWSECSQRGVAPLKAVSDLLIQPDDRYVACDALTYTRHGLAVEVKLDPLEQGLEMFELERVFANAVSLPTQSLRFRSPDLADQLVFALYHLFKDRFCSDRSLVDVHFLSLALKDNDLLWNEFVGRVERENLQAIMIPGLFMAKNRLGSPIPDFVVARLIRRLGQLQLSLACVCTPRFSWNQSSLFMLICNAVLLGDSHRKFSALGKTIFPGARFLNAYYAEKLKMPVFILLLVHWFNLIVPSCIMRHSIARYLWRIPPRQVPSRWGIGSRT